MTINWLIPLTLVYATLFAVALLLSRKRLLVPGVLFLGSFTAMLTCCSVFNWYFNFHIKPETFGIMSVAAVLFFITELTYASCLRARNRKVYLKHPADLNDEHGPQPILLRKTILNGLIIFMLLCIGLALVNLFLQVGGRDWHELMSHYNYIRRFTKGAATWRFTAIGQLTNLVIGLAYVNTYILIYNKVICNVALRRQVRALVIDLLFVPFTMVATSGRQATVELVIYACLLSILLLQLNGRKPNFKKIIFEAGGFLVAFITLFTLSASYVGRGSKFKDIFAVFDYIGLYLCGGLYNINDNVGKVFSHMYWGENTFAHIYAFFAKFDLIPAAAVKTYHAFGYRGGATTVTTYGRWYEDFGAVGVYIMTTVMALFFCYLFYSKVLAKSQPNVSPIIYLNCAMALVWASYDDRFYALLAFGNLIKFFWMIVFCRWLVHGKGKFLNVTAKVRIVGSKNSSVVLGRL